MTARTTVCRRRPFHPVVAVTLLAMAAAMAPAPRTAGAQAIASPSYVLADTWEDRPWSLTAGRLRRPVDATSIPDGRTVMLDEVIDGGGFRHAVHVLAPSGQPESVRLLPDRLSAQTADHTSAQRWDIQRMDGSPDGTLAVLGKRFDGVSTIAVTDIEGHVLREMQLPPIADMIYGDVAVAPDGRYFASVVDIERLDDPERTEAATSIVVLTPSGAVEREIDFQAIFPVDHSIPGHAHALVRGIDVASDGRLFALIAFRGCG